MAGVISSQQLRELARILASTSGAMKMQGDIPVEKPRRQAMDRHCATLL